MTRLVTSITAATAAELRTKIEQTTAAGAEWIELRLDALRSETTPAEVAEVLGDMKPGSWIATMRSADEGGRCPAPAEKRLAFLLEATTNREGCIDFEYRPVRSEPCRSAWAAAADRRRWILSCHDFEGSPEDVPALAREIASAGREVIAKVAWQGRELSDNIVALRIMRELPDRAIAVVLGDIGVASRVLAAKFGAAATYCAQAAGSETAPGQLTLDEMLSRYRWRSISSDTKVYGVLGDPVAHSLSPALFNKLFDHSRIDAVYLPWLATGGESELAGFLKQCERHDWLDIGGFSVTLPHKQAARRFVGERVQPLAARIGAVNTLVRRDGRFHGHNTDYAGALDALCQRLGTSRAELGGLGVDVLGAGGAARAVVAGLTDCGCRVTVYNRTPGPAEELAREFGCRRTSWENRAGRMGQIVINCTSVGMWPNTEETPLPVDGLSGRPVVFDTIYRPAETRLLRDAKQAGCVTIDGVEMFVRQAAAQYEFWFNQAPDVNTMRRIVLHEVRQEDHG